MSVLVLDADLLSAALAEAGDDEPVIAVDPSADRLEHLMRSHPDPRISWLIGDGEIVPLPDASVDSVHGWVADAERRRVLRP